MRKIFAFIFLIAVLNMLAGCQHANMHTPSDTTASETDPTKSSDETSSQDGSVIAENLYAISVPVKHESTLSNDSSVKFYYMYQNMYLTVPDADVAEKIIIDFLTRTDNSHAEAKRVHDQAELDYNGSENWIPYTYQVKYNPTRIDQGVLSLFGEILRFTGGSHSERTYVSANYDMVTGDVLTLGSILYHLDSKDDLCDLIIEKLAQIKETKNLYSNFEDAVREYFEQDESHLECFYFSDDSLCFYFAPYELAPYSSGIITVSIPYNELTGIIGDQFFPIERQKTFGVIEAHLFSEVDQSKFSQFAEITTDPGGEKVFLSTNGTVHNIQIHAGSWNEEGTAFYKEATVFAANVLSKSDAIMLETFIPDVTANLLLSYESDGQTVLFFIYQSGEDGSIILQPANQ